MYEDPSELAPLIKHALSTEPTPMSPMEVYSLSWEAASERLLDAAALPKGTPRNTDSAASQLQYFAHYLMGVQPIFDVFRTVTGAGPVVPWSQRLEHGAVGMVKLAEGFGSSLTDDKGEGQQQQQEGQQQQGQQQQQQRGRQGAAEEEEEEDEGRGRRGH